MSINCAEHIYIINSLMHYESYIRIFLYKQIQDIKYRMIKFHDFDIKMLQASFFPKENL